MDSDSPDVPEFDLDELEALRIQNEKYEEENEELRRILGDDFVQLADEIEGSISEDFLGGGSSPMPEPETTTKERASRALKANRDLQERVKRLISSIMKARDNIDAMRAQLLATIDRKKAKAAGPYKSTSLQRDSGEEYSGSSWFWSTTHAKEIPMYKNYRSVAYVAKHLPLVFKSGGWSNEEVVALGVGVVELAKERLIGDLVSSKPEMTIEDLEEMQQPIRELTLESEEVLSLSLQFSHEEWSTLAGRHIPSRTGLDCKMQWLNKTYPKINNTEFTDEERSLLVNLIQRYGEHAWDAVAHEMPGRTPLTCLREYERYKFTMNRDKTASITIPDSDMTKLIQLISKYGQSWKKIQDEMGGPLNADQLMHTWRKRQLGTDRGTVAARKGLWSKEEDAMLLKGVALYGKNWSKLVTCVPGRTDVQCRERYVNVLDPSLNKEATFTKEEEELLDNFVRAQREEGASRIAWSRVAKHLPGRTDRQCKKAWEKFDRRRKREERTRKRMLEKQQYKRKR